MFFFGFKIFDFKEAAVVNIENRDFSFYTEWREVGSLQLNVYRLLAGDLVALRDIDPSGAITI